MSRKISAPINIPANVDPQLRSALQAIKESLEVTVGQRGDPLDRAPSIRELIGTGVFTSDMYRGGQLRPPSEGGGGTGTDGGWSGPLPAPQNVTVTGTATAISVRWGIAPGAASAIAYTEIWAQGPSEFGETLPPADVESAELVAVSAFLRTTLISQSNRQWRIFVRHARVGGGFSPWHDIAGTLITTSRLAADVLAEVEGELGDIHLDTVLGGRIDLIDENDGILDRLAHTRAELFGDELVGTVGLKKAWEDFGQEFGFDPTTGAFTGEAWASSVDGMIAQVEDPDTGLLSRASQTDFTDLETFVGPDGAAGSLAHQVSGLETTITDPDTGLSTRASSTQTTNLGSTMGVDPDTGEMVASGFAQSLDQLRLDIGDASALVSQVSDIQETVDGLDAEWAIVVDANDIISGISVRSSEGAGSSIQMLANSYALWDPGPNYATDPSDKSLVLGYATIDGESLLSLQNVHITHASMDAATINGMLTADDIDVPGAISGETITGVTLQGGELMLGETGAGALFGPDGNWVTYISSAGDLYAANAYIRGDVEATSLAASVSLTVGDISDAGALASQDSVDYSGVTGTKPPTDADNTSDAINSTIVMTAGTIRAGKSGVNDTSGTGYALGFSGSSPRFIVGNSSNYLRWNGTSLIARGDIEATSAAIGSITTGSIEVNGVSDTRPFSFALNNNNIDADRYQFGGADDIELLRMAPSGYIDYVVDASFGIGGGTFEVVIRFTQFFSDIDSKDYVIGTINSSNSRISGRAYVDITTADPSNWSSIWMWIRTTADPPPSFTASINGAIQVFKR